MIKKSGWIALGPVVLLVVCLALAGSAPRLSQDYIELTKQFMTKTVYVMDIETDPQNVHIPQITFPDAPVLTVWVGEEYMRAKRLLGSDNIVAVPGMLVISNCAGKRVWIVVGK